ncbi:hypothetical protein J4465_01170 [Candidatus Pacearchaeota archaeon]|nr:hypothetical protein [Candidatus Pacearchaeota archaeon]
MKGKLEDELIYDTMHIAWLSKDEELITNAMGFYTHEITDIVKEYASGQRNSIVKIDIEKKYNEDYSFGMVVSPTIKKFLNKKKVILNGYVLDLRPGKNSGLTVLRFKGGYHQKEGFVRWAVKTLMR